MDNVEKPSCAFVAIMPHIRCAVLLISAIALPVLWGGIANNIFIVLLAVFWILQWRTLRSAMPSIGKKDVIYVAFAVFFCAMSGALFVVKHKDALWESESAATGMPAAVLASTVIAIPFTASFVKLLRDVGRGQLALPTTPLLCAITTHWPRLCYAVAAIGLAVLIVFSFSYDIWFDEAYSLALIKYGYADMLELIAQDAHPPLYYLILKTIVGGVQFLVPAIPAIFIAKMVSVLTSVLLFVTFITKVRKEWGQYIAALGVVCLVGMHFMLDFELEVRMYSWGMCFVTLAFIEVKDVLAKGRFIDWTLFVVYSLCASYTHYFACIAVAFLYIVLLVRICRTGGRQFRHWAVAVAITIVGYLPWLAVFIAQLNHVNRGFWIGSISMKTIMAWLVRVADNPLLVIAVTYLLARTAKSVRNALSDGSGTIAITGILVPVFVIAVGVAASWLMRPIFFWRYLVPSFGCFWLGVLILTRTKFNRQVRILAAGLIVMTSVANIAGFAYKQHVLTKENRRVMSFLQSQPDNAAYIVRSTPTAQQLSTYVLSELSGNDCYYYWKTGTRPSPFACQIFGVGVLTDVSEVPSILSCHQPVYYIVFKESDEGEPIDVVTNESELNYTHVGEFRLSHEYELDMNIIDIYRLSLKAEKVQP